MKKKIDKRLFKIEELEPRLELSEWDGVCNYDDNTVNAECNNTACETNNGCEVEDIQI